MSHYLGQSSPGVGIGFPMGVAVGRYLTRLVNHLLEGWRVGSCLARWTNIPPRVGGCLTVSQSLPGVEGPSIDM